MKLPSQDERSEKRLVEPLSKAAQCTAALHCAAVARLSCADCRCSRAPSGLTQSKGSCLVFNPACTAADWPVACLRPKYRKDQSGWSHRNFDYFAAVHDTSPSQI